MTPTSDIALLVAVFLAAIRPVALDNEFKEDNRNNDDQFTREDESEMELESRRAPERRTNSHPEFKREGSKKGNTNSDEVPEMDFKPRIVGGRSANIATYPYVVSMQVSNTHACGGSIISKHFVITAAHCFFNPVTHQLWSTKQLSVLSGSSVSASPRQLQKMQLVKSIQRRGVKRCLPAPGHNPWKEGIGPDLGLIEVNEPFHYNRWVNVAPLALGNDTSQLRWPDGKPPPGTVCQTMGWGHVKPVPTGQQMADGASMPVVRPSMILNVVDLPIFPFDQCLEYYEMLSDKQHICTLAKDKDACNGDSGGPMVCEGQQVAIVMAGDGCAQPGSPGAFTLIEPHRSWILSVISDKYFSGNSEDEESKIVSLRSDDDSMRSSRNRQGKSSVSRLDCRDTASLVLLCSLWQAFA